MTMRVGGSHHWRYGGGHWYEKKVRPGVWKFRYSSRKYQRPRPGVRSGSRYKWKINAVQYARKERSGRYSTHMVGQKKLIRARVKKRRFKY